MASFHCSPCSHYVITSYSIHYTKLYDLQLLAGRLDNDFDPRLQQVLLVGELKFRPSAPEQAGKNLLELGVDLLEGFPEALAGGPVDLGDCRLQSLQ